MVIRSFRIKLALSFFVLAVVPLIAAAFILDNRLERSALEELKSSLHKQALLVGSQLPVEPVIRRDREYLSTVIRRLGEQIQTRITVVDISGSVLADSEKDASEVPQMESHAGRPEIQQAIFTGKGEQVRFSPTVRTDMLYLAVPVKENDKTLAVVRLALPLTQVGRMMESTRNTIILILLGALFLAVLIGLLLIRAVVKPINRIIYASRKFSRGEFGHRIHHDAPDELGALAETLNRMAQDIEDKIKRVQIQNQQLRSVFESMVEGMILVDSQGIVLSVNPTVERMFGVSKDKTEGGLFLETFRNSDISEIIGRVLADGKAVSQELSIIWPVKKTFQINAAPIFEAGSTAACLLVLHDITEIRRLETIRSDFVANVSHELKTPLTSIRGFVETLCAGAVEDKENARHFLGIIQEHSERLNNLINDLLDLAYLESKEISMNRQQVDLRALVERVISGFQAQLSRKAVSIVNDVPADILVQADKTKLEQVLTNLIDNAIKFNRKSGAIRILCSQEKAAVKVLIEDSGLGIPVKDLPRIFERFYRVDKARSRELGGTGLGLAIVKHIVELHGGTVGVDSTEGHGSSFYFTIPA